MNKYSLYKDSTTCNNPSPCGKNTECSLINNRAICKCLPSFQGNPYRSNCYKSCKNNQDCSEESFCNLNLQTCEDPCLNYACNPLFAECNVSNHYPKCVKKEQGETNLRLI